MTLTIITYIYNNYTNLLWDQESSGTFKYCSDVRSMGKQATARLSLGTDRERIDPNGSSGNNVFPLYNSLQALYGNVSTKQRVMKKIIIIKRFIKHI